jgi:hypothetical protein
MIRARFYLGTRQRRIDTTREGIMPGVWSDIEEFLLATFGNYVLLPGEVRWKSSGEVYTERSRVYEVMAEERSRLALAASTLKQMANQQSVMFTTEQLQEDRI